MSKISAMPEAGTITGSELLEVVQDGANRRVRADVLALAGPQGPVGPPGAQGPAGPQGERGLQGFTGPQGEQGMPGPSGLPGLPGAQGPTGPKGDDGMDGPQGPIGPRGFQGEVGPTGLTGATGAQGPQGIQGPIGPQGIKGDTGAVGPTGPMGPIGPQGIQGLKGDKGDKGDQGNIGPQGAQGVKGDTGDTGVAGPQGPIGPQGDIGPAGPQGPQGIQGIQGVVGPVGPKGDIGDTGPIGPQGIQGDTGEIGPEGPQGEVGPAGTTTWAGITDKPLVIAAGADKAAARSAIDAEAIIANGTVNEYWRGDKTWRNLATDVRAVVLTGLSTVTNAVISASDTVLGALGKLQKQVTDHKADTGNPHAVTKAQVGLGSVDDTPDLSKPVSGPQQLALDGKADLVGGKVPASQLPSFVDDVLEYADLGAFPATGESGKMYTALDSNKVYRWSGSVYVEISGSPGSTDAVTEGATNLYFTEARVRSSILTGLSTATNAVIAAGDSVLSALGKLQKQFTDHFANTSNPHSVTKAQVGLANVDDTADSTKPVSGPQATALAGKVAKIGDTMTGTLTVAPASGSVAQFNTQATGAADAAFQLAKGQSGRQNAINAYTGAIGGAGLRWQVVIGNGTAESSTATGSDFQIHAYNNSGTYLFSPFSIVRSTGAVSIATTLSVGQLITCPGNIASSATVSGSTVTASTSMTCSGPIYAGSAGFASQGAFSDGANYATRGLEVNPSWETAAIQGYHVPGSWAGYRMVLGTNSPAVYEFRSSGALVINGTAVQMTSDRRIKTNITRISGVLDKLEELSLDEEGVVEYDLLHQKQLDGSAVHEMGTVAQVLQGLFPVLVHQDKPTEEEPDPIRRVNYSGIGVVAALGVGELRREVRGDVQALTVALEQALQRISELEARLAN